MIECIKEALKEKQISIYQINEKRTQSVELFFIKKQLDMRRGTDVINYNVTVYRDFEEGDNKYRGSASVILQNGMSKDEIAQKLVDAYYAASFAKNKWYPLPKGEQILNVKEIPSNMSKDWQGFALKTAEAVLAVDTCEDVFINSLEIFTRCIQVRIINSEGIDVSYRRYRLDGEFVAQCPAPQDVETYEDFEYDSFDQDEIQEKVRRTLRLTKDRAVAVKAPEAGEYSVILSGKYVPTVMEYYCERSHASLVYQGYSNYHIGDDVQMAGNEDKVVGERLNIRLLATSPYSGEGIPMEDRVLLENGTLKTIHGGARFCHYMGVTPTGDYQKIEVKEGTTSFEDMKKTKYLHVVNFSDFQMDSMSGNFAGEIRLAYLYDGTTVTPVTGGSINGSITKAQKSFVFSKEKQSDTEFTGPMAIRMDQVMVAGQSEE